MLRNYENLIEKCNDWLQTKNAEEFGDVIETALDVFDSPQRKFAEKFNVSISTISRWSKGTTAPLPLVQEHVVETLKKEAAEKASYRGLVAAE